ncbi:MAG: hypothetical protein HYZ62_01995 [Candidatus Andersenbacteria bacterium]|nr:hypothetical protein [Candidatus Andersenbacteria bacterium]
MIITTYGTRGSIPVAGHKYARYGGNTTCLEVESTCLPPHTRLVVDAGSGIMPLAADAAKQGAKKVILLLTHYHYDHTQGLLLCPFTYRKDIELSLYGPEENRIGPKQMLSHVMRPPFHPVSMAEVSSHMSFMSIAHPAGAVFVVHPEGGICLFAISEFERAERREGGQIKFSYGRTYLLQDCLVIHMYRSNHPERTISYRFEERPTGKVFVFLTDHENTDSTPSAFCDFLKLADLLIMDSQYSREKFEQDKKSGFGHSTPDFCVGVACEAQVKHLGLTHHDPLSDDAAVDAILAEAQVAAKHIGYRGQVSACHDFERFELIF